MAAAAARLQAQDPAGAARMLEAITAREPANGRAWRMLGVAYQRAKELDKALAAYRKALEIEPGAPQVLYNMGTAYALKQDADAAFEWLGRAKATRKLDMTQIDSDADLAALKSGSPLPRAAARARRLRAAVRRDGEGDPRVGRRGGQRSVRVDCAGHRRRRSRRRPRHRDLGADQGHRRRGGRPRLCLFDQEPARCSGASTAIPAISLAAASRPPATPTTTACPTSSPARLARARPTSTPARTDAFC